jgi:signal transduction histidine kinase
MMFADKRLVKQIALNLVSNGIKFIPEGGTVSCSLMVSPTHGITILVSDNGVGMSPEEAKRALEPFTQLSEAKSRNQMGTGLGLTLVKRFTELHNGVVEITSQRGKGTDVRVIFPASRLRHNYKEKSAPKQDALSIDSAVISGAD